MTASLQEQAEYAVRRLRELGTDSRTVEAKAAQGGLPKRVTHSVSAFANTGGGLLLLGLKEPGFQSLQVDTEALSSALSATCADDLEPPIRPEIDTVTIDGHSVVAALIDELSPERKPCYVKTRGLNGGSFVRVHDGNRRLSHYEVHVLVSGQGQPRNDMATIDGVMQKDLDPELVSALVRRMRRRGPTFARANDNEILRMVGVLVGDNSPKVSLAGLLSLGRYPQQFRPQLNITFVAYPTVNGEPLDDGTRFLDNEPLDGPIPEMLAGALTAVRRNLTRRAVITGEGRLDQWEYPEEAVRELIVNALVHRDYHPSAHGAQVRVELYPDRLEIVSPGGLHGSVDREKLLTEPVTSSRNAQLAKLLEDVEVPRSGRTVCENRGSGLVAIAAFLRKAGLEPPTLRDDVSSFKVIVRNHVLLGPASAEWLSTFSVNEVNDRQRLGLAFLRRNSLMTNSQYRILTGCDFPTVSKDLNDLASKGLIEKSDDRLWVVWRLTIGAGEGGTDQRGPLTKRTGVIKRGDRALQIQSELSKGSMSTRELAQQLGVTRQAVLWWLNRLEKDGVVRPTQVNRRSPRNKWELVSE